MKKNIFLIFSASLFLIFSFPDFNLSFLAFITFIPLFFAIENKSPKKAFLISYLCGFLFYLGTLYWLYHVTTIGLIILCLYLASYFGIFGFILRAKSRRINLAVLDSAPSVPRSNNIIGLLLIPIIWSILEYIQAHLFTGFGWCLLGYSQYKNLPLIQIADFSGVYGVSFLIMMVNVGLYMSLRGAKRRSNPCNKIASSASSLLAMTGLVLIVSYTYGFFRLNERQDRGSINVSVIQGNISQEAKWDFSKSAPILEKYINLTALAALDNPDLIIWPETSFPDYFDSDTKMTKEVLELARSIKTPILLGANTEQGIRNFNSALLISGDGEVVDKYDKIHLVPFGEYVPFSDKFPILHKLILGELGEFTPAVDFKVFTLQKAEARPRLFQKSRGRASAFSVLICFEDIFPELARRFVKNGADFLVVITNDAWYGKSSAAYQHAACSVFRAIENRVPIVRCANTGYSCFIDSRGRIYDSIEQNGSHLFITGYKTSPL